MIKAKTLKKGDVIGIVSPSSPMAARVKYGTGKESYLCISDSCSDYDDSVGSKNFHGFQ